jgi:hypothetical protein
MHGLGAMSIFSFLIPIGERRGGIMVVGSLGPISNKALLKFMLGLIGSMAQGTTFPFHGVCVQLMF